MHGDLKPDNLLMSSSGKVKISDFGSARFCEKSDMIFATAGTPTFMAPEMCQGGWRRGAAWGGSGGWAGRMGSRKEEGSQGPGTGRRAAAWQRGVRRVTAGNEGCGGRLCAAAAQPVEPGAGRANTGHKISRSAMQAQLCSAHTWHVCCPDCGLAPAGKQFNGFPGDIWALGICLFMFVFGKPPFVGATTYQIYEAIQRAELAFPHEIPVSGELKVGRGCGDRGWGWRAARAGGCRNQLAAGCGWAVLGTAGT